jgi:hypothetical protein
MMGYASVLVGVGWNSQQCPRKIRGFLWLNISENTERLQHSEFLYHFLNAVLLAYPELCHGYGSGLGFSLGTSS